MDQLQLWLEKIKKNYTIQELEIMYHVKQVSGNGENSRTNK